MKKIGRAAMERDEVTRRENRRGRDWSRETSEEGDGRG
jgi:hypothetical protein